MDYRKKKCTKYAANYDYWADAIPHTCPCTQKQATADFRFKPIVKNRDFTTFESVFEQDGLKEQCVYIPGPYGSGTLTTGQPYGGSISVPNTTHTDRYMRKLCCHKKPSYCKQFFHHRPSSSCKNYRPPRLGKSKTN